MFTRFVATSLLASAMLFAQGPAANRFPVIVEFRDDARFSDFQRHFQADDPRSSQTPGWSKHDQGVLGAAMFLERRLNFVSDYLYSSAIKGFAARLSASQIQQLENDPMVASIEPDAMVTTTAQALPWGINKIAAPLSTTLAGDGAGAVSGVNAYVIDTGIAAHADLNLVAHKSFVNDGKNTDCHGHGTHVAGTIGARDNAADVVGVAPGIALTGVKVMGCTGSGYISGVIAGLDWVRLNAVKPAVANLSFGGAASTSLDNAVINLANSGVFVAIAAGNSGVNVCTVSPARAGAGTDNGVMTVSATDSYDKEASWSNYGSCKDIHAPGVSVVSTSMTGGTTTKSGTSMASPHVAGAAALLLSKSGNAGLTPAQVEARLRQDAAATLNTSKDATAIKVLSVRNY